VRIVLPLGPTGCGGKTVSAAGVSNPSEPNSTAPSVVPLPSVSISRFIACTRRRLASVNSIEIESSTIASMSVAGVQAALADGAAEADAAATAIARRPATTAAESNLATRLIFFSPTA
jgi:hypothetical protein